MPTVIPFEDVSPEDLASLWNECYPSVQITAEDVSRVLDEHFEQEGSFAAVEGMDLAGCVLSQFFPEVESDRYWPVETPGVILAVLVRPSHRRQGAGSQLLKMAESRHAERGRTKVLVGGMAGLPGFAPGIDPKDITARLFLTKFGYRPARTTVEMHAGCSKMPSKELAMMEAQVLAKAIAIVSSEAGDEAEYVLFLKKSARGADPLALERWMSSPENTVLARRGMTVIGAASVEQKSENEFVLRDACVAPDERRNGVGSALLARALRLVGARGVRRLTVFAPRGSDAFFRKLGFAPSREWLSFFKPLRHQAGEGWVERYRESR